jgi:hypothetical protein
LVQLSTSAACSGFVTTDNPSLLTISVSPISSNLLFTYGAFSITSSLLIPCSYQVKKS